MLNGQPDAGKGNKQMKIIALATTIMLGALVFSPAQLVAGPNPTGEDSDAGVFNQWLTADAPECVPISKVRAVSKVVTLTPEQFQFVRALYIAIPPVSRELPPGDSAILASAGGKSMIALVADGQTCARFLATDFILTMLDQVATGQTGKVGTPL